MRCSAGGLRILDQDHTNRGRSFQDRHNRAKRYAGIFQGLRVVFRHSGYTIGIVLYGAFCLGDKCGQNRLRRCKLYDSRVRYTLPSKINAGGCKLVFVAGVDAKRQLYIAAGGCSNSGPVGVPIFVHQQGSVFWVVAVKIGQPGTGRLAI